MGVGHGHMAELAHGLAAAGLKGGETLGGREGIPFGSSRCGVTAAHVGGLGGDLLDRLAAAADRLLGDPGLELGTVGQRLLNCCGEGCAYGGSPKSGTVSRLTDQR
jgi:hypothetical protein